MSKVVRSVGNAIGGVVKGVTKAVTGVVKGAVNAVKTVAKSKLGKIALIAAATYFGVPAISGAFGGGAAAASGLSGFAGASANLSAAWEGLTGAAAALGSGNLAGAGQSLAQGFTGSAATTAATTAADAGSGMLGSLNPSLGSQTVGLQPALDGGAALATGADATTGAAIGGSGFSFGANAPLSGVQPGATSFSFGPNGPLPSLNAPPDTSWGSQMLKSITNSPYTGAAVVTTAGGMLNSLGQASAVSSQQQYQEKLAADARARYNKNVGANLWGTTPTKG